VLFRIGALEIRAYGLMLALSFIIGIYFSVKRAKSRDIDPNHIMDLSVILIISAIVGSRLLYVLFHLEEFRGHWLDTINPFQSDGQIGIAGLTVLGGVILCFVSSAIFLHMKKLPFYKFADVLMPAVGLGIFLTRIGCYLNGCCYGLPCEGHEHFCVTFPLNSPAGAHFPGIPLVPAQLYSSIYGLIIFATLLVAERWKKFDGFLLALFLILYGISRFLVDVYRYYEDSMVILAVGERGISLNQGISGLMVFLGIILLIYGYSKVKRTASE
jgi:phosphatidylglycerol:prolipoprotein diacylglycerol transferase